ncbi:MAG: hypothetical protein PW792_10040 [Acidobacteriaceae bacterium]|nr:hypothetical protein [Acidobacteriaceae bacterium]
MTQRTDLITENVGDFMQDTDWLLNSIRSIHAAVRKSVVEACENSLLTSLSEVADDSDGDTIYAVDRISEEMLVELFEREVASRVPIVLIAEGLSEGKIVLPRGSNEADAVWRIIADPIDGTRLLMYQKRSAWILTGVAPNRGEETNLSEIVLAVQTEIPLIKQHLSDVLWARRGEGAQAERFNRLTQQSTPLHLQPSKSPDLAHGFASVTRFFAGGRDILAAVDDQICFSTLGPGREGKAQSFEDQYLSTGGQLYELMVGHDRFQADLRPLLTNILRERGLPPALCCHPYDLCTEMIAREAGVLVLDDAGHPMSAPMNLTADISWVGYANSTLRKNIEPLLLHALEEYGLERTKT